MILNVLKKLVQPKSESEDKARQEFILNVLLLSTIFLILAGVFFNVFKKIWGDPVTYKNDAMSLASLFFVLIFYVFLFFASKKGFFRAASYIFISVYFTMAFYMAQRWGIDVQAGLLFFILTIIISGILIGTSFAFKVTSIIAVCLIALNYLQTDGLLQANDYWRKIAPHTADTIMYAAVFFVIAAITWLANRETEKSLARARNSEAKLKQERDSLEIKVKERTKKLKQAQMEKMSQLYRFAELGRLSSGLLHDLSNPLTAVSLNIEKINNTSLDKTMGAENYAKQAIVAARRMEKFIDAARKQIAREKNKTFFSLAEEAVGVIQLLSRRAIEVKAKIFFLPSPNIEVYGDAVKFSQVIMNLLANAIDSYENFEGCGGRQKKIELALRKNKDWAIITVEDWGCGIKKENREKIFQSFFTTKKFEQGTGIGLSLARNIIENDFGGRISVESEEYLGAKFTVELPINEEGGSNNCGRDWNIDFVEKIALNQLSEGGFPNSKDSPSIFYTALILFCLNKIKETERVKKIKKRASEYLLSQKNENWMFSKNMHVNFCVLSALAEYDRNLLGGEALAKILTVLTLCEAKEGGPYYSWTDKKSEEIDLAANASIAYFLSLYGVRLPELNQLFFSAVESEFFNPGFYDNFFPVLFFVAKIVDDEDCRRKLKNFIWQKGKILIEQNSLNHILAVSSLIDLGCEKDEAIKLTMDFDRFRARKLFAPESFLASSATGGGETTSALKLAFYLEATTKIKRPLKKKKENNADEEKMLAEIIGIAEKRFFLLKGDIKDFALAEIKRTIKGNRDRQMPLMPFYFRKALGKNGEKFSDKFIAKLGLANVFFWTAFIIYDDFWDEEGEPRILPTANLYARSFTKFYASLFSSGDKFNDYFRLLMDKLDAANTWETVYCRAKVTGSRVLIPDKLPDYGNYDLAYEPASAHILGPLAMLYLIGLDENSSDGKNTISYLRNYLIAMQLNDDMHDWEGDLKRGHLSTVVVMLLKDFKEEYPGRREIDMAEDLPEIKRIFWFKTIINACNTAIWHAEESRKALHSLRIIEDAEPLEKFIKIIENSAQKALQEQKSSLEFLKHFKTA